MHHSITCSATCKQGGLMIGSWNPGYHSILVVTLSFLTFPALFPQAASMGKIRGNWKLKSQNALP